nr:sulfite reductase [nadph] subunit beta [Quercus suber]
MLHEVLLALSGHISPLFPDRELNGTKPLTDKFPLLSPSEAASLRSIGELSNLHRKLRDRVKLIALKHKSTIGRAVATSIQRTHLARFQNKILDVETRILTRNPSTVGAYKIVPLAGIVAEFDEWHRRLIWYWEVATFMQNVDGHECSGSALIGKLRLDAQTGFRDLEEAALELSRVAETTWLRQLASWLLYGKVPLHGAHDFFVQSSSGTLTRTGLIFSKDKTLLPEFLTSATASAALFVGKTLHQIRQYEERSKTMSSDRNATTANRELVSKHLSLLSSLSVPLVPAQLTRAISAIRLSLSRNVLQRLLPMTMTLQLLSCLREFFLLSRGEFGGNLIIEAENRMRARQQHMGRALQRDVVKALQGLSLKDAELHQTLAQTWKTLVRQQDEGPDDVLEFARSHLSLAVPKPMSPRPSSSDSIHGVLPQLSPVLFNDLLFPTQTSLQLNITPPLDLILTDRDMETYASINSYLLSFERARLRLSDMWRRSNARRSSSTPEARFEFKDRRARALKRTQAMRKVWATCSSTIFLISETAAYFEGEIVRGSSDHFESWIKLPVSSQNAQMTTIEGGEAAAERNQHDPETIASCHRAFLAALAYSLLLTDVSYTREVRSLLGNIDALIAFFNRLVDIQQELDIEHHAGGESSLTQEDERNVALELDRARKKVDSDLRSVITRLRQLDQERIGSLRYLDLKPSNVGEIDGFQPWRGGGLERLLMKVDSRGAWADIVASSIIIIAELGKVSFLGLDPDLTMASILTAAEGVARIAYLTSDVVVSVQSALAAHSEFSKFLHQYAEIQASSLVCRNTPEILSVRYNADPLLSAFEPVRNGKITTVTTNSGILVKSIPHLYRLAQHPIVIHVALHPAGYPDYADITSVRNAGFTFLQSHTLQEAQDLALTAHALAITSGKGVIHFFDPANSKADNPIPHESRELVMQVVDVELVRQYQANKSSETTLYVSEGQTSANQFASSEKSGRPLPTSNGSAQKDATDGGASSPKDASSASSASSVRNDSSSGASLAESATTVDSQTKRFSSDDVDSICTEIWAKIKSATGRRYSAFNYTGPSNAEAALFLFGSDPGLFAREFAAASPNDFFNRVGLITPVLYKPWLGDRLVESLPPSVKKIAVLEQIRRKTTKWGPILLDVLVSFKSSNQQQSPLIVGYQLGYIEFKTVTQALSGIFQNVLSKSPIQNLEVGLHTGPTTSLSGTQKEFELSQGKLENAYMKILDQLYGQRLYIANALDSKTAGVSDTIKASPEFGFGSLLARKDHKQRFIQEVQAAAKSNEFTTESPRKFLSQWALSVSNTAESDKLAPQVISRLSTDGSPLATKFLKSKGLFFNESQWLVGSDAWAYDLGNSGVHHVLASGENVNMLIIDSTPYSERVAQDAARRKKDIGLYAMNFGNAYVASVAVYSSYTQVLQAMIEAEKFDGPSVVMAYLPYNQEDDNPITVLQETKKAVDIGYWPLYRWNPREDDSFKLDSERIKHELQEFLRRDNHLTQLMRRHPQFHAGLSESYGSEVRQVQKRKAKDAYAALLEGMVMRTSHR